jgi:hypothetical protein
MGYSDTFEDANPTMAYQKLLFNNLLSAAQAQGQFQKNDFSDMTLADQLRQVKAKTTEDEATAKYAEPSELAKLIQSQNQGRLTGQEADWYKDNAETKYMPLDYAIKAAQATNTADRFGGSYQLAKILQARGKDYAAQFQAQNPEAYNQMVTDLANKAANQQQSAGSQILTNVLSKFFPTSQPQQINQQQSNNENKDLLSSLTSGTTGQTTVQHPEGPFKTTDEGTEQQKLLAQSDANKYATDAKIRNRAEGAVALEST